jgi:CheY-like chemotaxis protein
MKTSCVAEDEKTAGHLRMLGEYRGHGGPNGQAVDMWLHLPLVLMDIQMPVMSGDADS